jgi:hypothetical protein
MGGWVGPRAVLEAVVKCYEVYTKFCENPLTGSEVIMETRHTDIVIYNKGKVVSVLN